MVSTFGSRRKASERQTEEQSRITGNSNTETDSRVELLQDEQEQASLVDSFDEKAVEQDLRHRLWLSLFIVTSLLSYAFVIDLSRGTLLRGSIARSFQCLGFLICLVSLLVELKKLHYSNRLQNSQTGIFKPFLRRFLFDGVLSMIERLLTNSINLKDQGLLAAAIVTFAGSLAGSETDGSFSMLVRWYPFVVVLMVWLMERSITETKQSIERLRRAQYILKGV
ncbi:expressed protein [Phakopsora pachyrhizi]|uniref:Expressed protein n=1 Tax=Phakopsora pachyrhizi TaxID=170000 RepID=A0AAV0AU04_PHAPC|nr:expressed protein [Phakopsora pachyrhizi]